MENVILTVHLILAVMLAGVVLLQRSEGGGLGMGGGGGGAHDTAGAAPAMAGSGGQRQLRHSSEAQEFGSWKTAHSQESRERHAMSAAASWPSTDRLWAVGSMPSQPSSSQGHHQELQAQQYSSSVAAAAVAGGTPEHVRSARLSGAEADQRAASLQEQHLLGFLASSGQDEAAQQQTPPTN